MSPASDFEGHHGFAGVPRASGGLGGPQLGPPLVDIRVVDLTSYIAGSYAAMMLADLGADVFKVESLAGDSFRELPGFVGWDRGKRSIALDLKAADGRQIVERLAAAAGVVMATMRPGVADGR